MRISDKIKKRLQSKIVWVAVLAQIVLIAMLVNPHVADLIKIVGGAVIEIATLFGILNNPDDPTSF